jgi:hypothetical protein
MKSARNYLTKLCVPAYLVISFLLLSCAESFPREDETGGKAASISTVPTRSELENATYSGFEGIEEIKGPVRLINGKWEGPVYTKDSATVGEHSLGSLIHASFTSGSDICPSFPLLLWRAFHRSRGGRGGS